MKNVGSLGVTNSREALHQAEQIERAKGYLPADGSYSAAGAFLDFSLLNLWRGESTYSAVSLSFPCLLQHTDHLYFVSELTCMY